jgi:hypothetical protein
MVVLEVEGDRLWRPAPATIEQAERYLCPQSPAGILVIPDGDEERDVVLCAFTSEG